MLGLLTPTDPRWIDAALTNLDAVLADHFHCELKAASNATALIARYPHIPGLVTGLSALAREELEHVEQVHAELLRRGVKPTPPGPDPYAIELRRAAQADHKGGDTLLERLLVAALIEARSCERFALLREHAPTPELRAWYADLFVSEAQHHRLFSSLAEESAGFEVARARMKQLAIREAELVGKLTVLPRVH